MIYLLTLQLFLINIFLSLTYYKISLKKTVVFFCFLAEDLCVNNIFSLTAKRVILELTYEHATSPCDKLWLHDSMPAKHKGWFPLQNTWFSSVTNYFFLTRSKAPLPIDCFLVWVDFTYFVIHYCFECQINKPTNSVMTVMCVDNFVILVTQKDTQINCFLIYL